MGALFNSVGGNLGIARRQGKPSVAGCPWSVVRGGEAKRRAAYPACPDLRVGDLCVGAPPAPRIQ